MPICAATDGGARMSGDKHVLFLRGINVGGRNILPMAALRDVLTGLGLRDVATHIQSGNVVFRAPAAASDLADRIGAAIEEQFGFRPVVMVLNAQVLAQVLAANPFSDEGAADAAKVQIGFLARPASDAVLADLTALAATDERLHLTELAFYLHAPSGIGRSKLAAQAERLLGVPMTMRNFRVATKVFALAEAD